MEAKNNPSIIIGDTSALVSMVIKSDSNHAHAVAGARYLAKQESSILIPAEVLAETVNLLGKKFDHTQAITTGRKLSEEEAFIVIETNELIRSYALDLMESTAGGVSYIDCLVVATAEHYSSNNIYGFDRYFRQRGFPFPGPKDDAA
jgi:predicted nucleic acid-binding protein